jgi:hypothetical protein
MVNGISLLGLAALLEFPDNIWVPSRGFEDMTISMTQLQSLARERLPGKRHELLRALTDSLFEPEHELSMKERELFDDIVERVLDDIEPLARRIGSWCGLPATSSRSLRRC